MGIPVNGGAAAASKVLYIRNIAERTSEEDVLRYCAAFGNIPEVLLFKDKRHGFVQFEELHSARACLDFYTDNTLAPHGPKIEFAFSGRDEITHKRDPALNPPNRILLVTISNIVYPVTVDVMQQIIMPYAASGMNRCVIFSRAEQIQALVELATMEDAVAVRETLDGLNIYPGANTLKVQYSSMTELVVKTNNTKSFDFTGSPERSLATALNNVKTGAKKEGGVPICIVRNVTERVKAEDLAAIFAVYGNVSHVKILVGKQRGVAIVQMQDALHCSVAQMNLQNVPLNGRHLEIEVSSQKSSSVGKPNEEGVARDFHDMPTYNRHKNDKVSKMYPPSSALHLSNMPDNTSPDEVLAVLRAAGAQVRNFKFLDNLNHIAVVLCTSLENAVKVICTAHNVPIGTPSRLLRVGFGAFRP
jgi:RNA recognition motif-containing protein